MAEEKGTQTYTVEIQLSHIKSGIILSGKDKRMKVAFIYQAKEPPVINGIKKPMKPGGYSDGCADMAYCLKNGGTDVITPAENPDVYKDTDWCFPDTHEGIQLAIDKGADTLWLNTVLYNGHPIDDFSGIYVVGHRTKDVEMYDDKFSTNTLLLQNELPAVTDFLVTADTVYTGEYPCVLKPIRGRGSEGVVKCDTPEEFIKARDTAFASGRYGDTMMAEEYLGGTEVTLTVFPNGTSLPFIERFDQKNGIAPYNGDVPVVKNSRVIEDTPQLTALRKSCELAVWLLGLKAVVRIDCRADKNGNFKMFDFNPKPNLTGASRPHRPDLNSLTLMAAQAAGMDYFGLLTKMLETRYLLD